MEPKEAIFTYDYRPGRTVEELEQERLLKNLKLSHSERFRKLTALIRLTKSFRIIPKPNSDGHSG